MVLREFLASRTPEQKDRFFKRLTRRVKTERGTVLVPYNRTYIYSFNDTVQRRWPSPELAKLICEASDGLVTLAELRLDIWGDAPTPDRPKRHPARPKKTERKKTSPATTPSKANGKKKPQRTARAS